MSTRGSVYVGKQRFYIATDAYPSYAENRLSLAAKAAKTADEFVDNANKIGYKGWVSKMELGNKFGYPFEEYRWKASLGKGVNMDKRYEKRFKMMTNKFWEEYNKLAKKGLKGEELRNALLKKGLM